MSERKHIVNMVAAISEGDLEAAELSFNRAFSIKASRKLESVRADVGKRKFGQDEANK